MPWPEPLAVRASRAEGARCPSDMVLASGYCIDRYEVSLIDRDSKEPLSPFYPPDPNMLAFVYDRWQLLRSTTGGPAARAMPLPEISDFQRAGKYTAMAVSQAGAVPQGYLSYYSAKRVCEAAGKRLCSPKEWEVACRGARDTAFPYGDEYQADTCNVGKVYHPASILHGLSSSGHLDPRLNLLMLDGDNPVLRLTGASQACASHWGKDAVFDMVGNLDEWVDDLEGTFKGGFYARRTTGGCSTQITNHGPTYFDYSTGVRCCRDAARPAP
ncbi:MAG TPA: SUMF1/EgtB/PvdO family nonheme iron enzyme [Polyangiaceae bacterium]|nr:SUMF1/EgtB/PvdO family nonheme iron enzyme [Polyangiaceae bacterium]